MITEVPPDPDPAPDKITDLKEKARSDANLAEEAMRKKNTSRGGCRETGCNSEGRHDAKTVGRRSRKR
jgi:hypothetical protein